MPNTKLSLNGDGFLGIHHHLIKLAGRLPKQNWHIFLWAKNATKLPFYGVRPEPLICQLWLRFICASAWTHRKMRSLLLMPVFFWAMYILHFFRGRITLVWCVGLSSFGDRARGNPTSGLICSHFSFDLPPSSPRNRRNNHVIVGER